jgi:hypothetical protein
MESKTSRARGTAGGTVGRGVELVAMAVELARALDSYRGGSLHGGAAARNVTLGFAAFFRAALPGAANEAVAALVELCVLETIRERLDSRGGTQVEGGAIVLDVPCAGADADAVAPRVPL